MENQTYQTILETAGNTWHNIFRYLAIAIVLIGFCLGIYLGFSMPKVTKLSAKQLEKISESVSENKSDSDDFNTAAMFITWAVTVFAGTSEYAVYLHLANQHAALNLMLSEHQSKETEKYGCSIRPRS